MVDGIGFLQFTLEHHASFRFSIYFLILILPVSHARDPFRDVSQRPVLRSPGCGAYDRRLHLLISGLFSLASGPADSLTVLSIFFASEPPHAF